MGKNKTEKRPNAPISTTQFLKLNFVANFRIKDFF